jgi:hypothetical protein
MRDKAENISRIWCFSRKIQNENQSSKILGGSFHPRSLKFGQRLVAFATVSNET